MSNAPTVSIVMAAYNGKRLIAETIASVIDQSLTDWELIVVDDGSTDGTRDLLARYDDPRIHVHFVAENGGPVLARNRAVSLARGRHIAALDQDDLCHPDRLARQVAFLDAHPEVAIVGTAAEHLHGHRTVPGFLPGTSSPALIRWLMLLRNPIVWSSATIRGEVARALHPFSRNERLYAEDFDLYHRAARFGTIARIDDPLLLYRVHEGNISARSRARMMTSTALVLAEAYHPLLGGYADEAATLVCRHIASGDIVTDATTLAALSAIIERLHEGFIAHHAPAADDLAAIGGETARLWWALVSRGIRGGTVHADDGLALRPAPIRAGVYEPGGFIASRLIGRSRAMLRGRSAA